MSSFQNLHANDVGRTRIRRLTFINMKILLHDQVTKTNKNYLILPTLKNN